MQKGRNEVEFRLKSFSKDSVRNLMGQIVGHLNPRQTRLLTRSFLQHRSSFNEPICNLKLPEDMAEERLTLQKKLTITPKTATLLIKLGYHDYRDLKNATTNEIISGFQKIPGITKKLAEGYRRAMRRLVWLGTQVNPEKDAKLCSTWTQKGLKKRGIWRDGFDDLTGSMIDDLITGKSEKA